MGLMSADFLQVEIFNNRVADYLLALITLFGGWITVKLIRCVVIERLKQWARRTVTTLDDALVKLIEHTVIPLLYLGAFYISISNLSLHPILKQFVDAIVLMLATFLGIRLMVAVAEYTIRLYWLTRRDSVNVEQLATALVPAIRTAAWALGIVFLLDNLGFNVSAVLTGVGIGGVALALASQGVLQDLFSYFAILFDRPFELGDVITVNEVTGTVKHVGIKTTRIQSISGEELIIANQDLTKSRVHNFRRMEKRRILFRFGVLYETSQEHLQQIPEIVQQIITGMEQVSFDRAHLFEFGEFSLNYEVVYFVHSNDYKLYMDKQQEINLKLRQEFDKKGIGFASSTQMHYLKPGNNDKTTDETIDRNGERVPAIQPLTAQTIHHHTSDSDAIENHKTSHES